VPPVQSGIPVDHQDAFVHVAIGDVRFVVRRIDLDVGRIPEERGPVASAGGRVAAAGQTRLADLHDESAVLGELEHLVVAAAVPGEPDVVVVIDEDPVLVVRPLASLCSNAFRGEEPRIIGTTPRTKEIAVPIELHDRRGAVAAIGPPGLSSGLVFGERSGALDDPDAIVPIDGHARDLADEPPVRQRLRPLPIHGECRSVRLAGPGLFDSRPPDAEADDDRRERGACDQITNLLHDFLPAVLIGCTMTGGCDGQSGPVRGSTAECVRKAALAPLRTSFLGRLRRKPERLEPHARLRRLKSSLDA